MMQLNWLWKTNFAELPDVVRVIPNSLHRLQTTRSWDFLGLHSQAQSNLLHNSNMGDKVIIGVLDTGLVIIAIYIYIYNQSLSCIYVCDQLSI